MKVNQSQYQKVLVIIVPVWAITIIFLSNCIPENQIEQSVGKPEVAATATAVNSNVDPETTIVNLPGNLIGEILVSPEKFQDKQVEITGYYHGWDLLKEVSNGSPVTRSDWVIADESGAIYVTGVFPEGLDPSSMDSAMTMVRLSATVEFNERGTYLLGQSVDVVPPD